MTYPYQVLWTLLLLISLASCSQNSLSTEGERPLFPVHHEEPDWCETGLIAFRDRGIVEVTESGAYISAPGLSGLWLLDPESGERERVLEFGRHPSWVPGADTIAFEHERSIWLLDVTSRGVWPVITGSSDFQPDGGAGGRVLWHRSTGEDRGVWVAGLDGSRESPVLAYSAEPHWHPTGTGFVCQSWDEGGDRCIVSYSMATQRKTVLYSGEGRWLSSPRYSPDGRTIAFCHQAAGQRAEIWLMDSSGSGSRVLTDGGGTSPAWSPSGDRIVYVRERPDDPCDGSGVLWIVDVSTGQQTQLTSKWEVE